MKAIVYVRVSTDRQAELGVSLEDQEAKIRAMATVQGAGLFESSWTGGILQEPEPPRPAASAHPGG
jgi:hypothetical protein